MALVLVVLEEKIVVVPFGVETSRLSCISIISEMVVTRKLLDDAEEPGSFTSFVCSNGLPIVWCVICYPSLSW